jgi:hypothetical protein
MILLLIRAWSGGLFSKDQEHDQDQEQERKVLSLGKSRS